MTSGPDVGSPKAIAIYSACTGDRTQHPYSIAKGIDPGPLIRRGAWPQRGWSDALIVPLYDQFGSIQSLEAIAPDGKKDFLAGCRKKGNFYPIGLTPDRMHEVASVDRVLIGEGVATMAAIHRATRDVCIAAMDRGNLKPVAETIKAMRHGHAGPIILCADNDYSPDNPRSNPGLDGAIEAAYTIGAKLAIPSHSKMAGRKLDFWDIDSEIGPGAISDIIESARDPIIRADPIPRNGNRYRPDLDRAHEERQDPRPLVEDPVMIDGAVLYDTEHPPVKWSVHQILPEGVALLIGKPKIKKSFLALGIALAIAQEGKVMGHFQTEPGDVLFLALEDHYRRITKRMRLISSVKPAEGKLTFATQWPRLGQGGIEKIMEWLDKHPDASTIVIDTLTRMRPVRARNGNAYDEDYEVGKPFVDLCKSHRIAVLIVHHARKMVADDPIDAASGTLGLTGGVDGYMVMTRAKNKDSMILHVDGRDIEESKDLPLIWDGPSCQWLLSTDPATVFNLTLVQRKVLDLIQATGPLKPIEIGAAMGIDADQWKNTSDRRAITRALKRLVDLDLISARRFDGRYEADSIKPIDEDFE